MKESNRRRSPSREITATDRLIPWAYIAVGVLLALAYFLIPGGRGGPFAVEKVVLYCFLSLSTAVAIGIGIVRYRPIARMAWLLLLVSQAVYVTGDIAFYVRNDLLKLTAFPSVSDVFYLLHYPALVICLVMLVRARSQGRDVLAMIDTGVVVTVAALFSWIFVIGPQIRVSGESLPAHFVSVAYPIGDYAMLAVAMWLVIGASRPTRSFCFLISALLVLFVTDTLYVLQQLNGTYVTGNFLDAMWIGCYLLLGAAALDPSMHDLGAPSPENELRNPLIRYGGLAFAAASVPVLLLLEQGRHTVFVLPVLAAGTAVLFLLVIVRMQRMVTVQRRAAMTDWLSGLPNRRYFETHLELDSARADRWGSHLTFILLGIDEFKVINDAYGHATGDRVLREAARRLSRVSKSADVLARYGGRICRSPVWRDSRWCEIHSRALAQIYRV